jgi:transposase
MVPISAFESFTNDAAGIAALAAFCRRHGAELAVMEATGGYERMAFLLLWQEGVSCALTNPRGVRRFAEAMGALEKTDRIDAGMIARFAIAKDVKATQPPSPSQQRLKALVARLRQVTGDLAVQKQRRAAAADAEILASLDEVIALLKRQAKTLEGEIASMIDDDPLWATLAETFRAVKGVAGRTVARLMADLPEIGLYSNKAVTKLVGLAPIADDSGKKETQTPVAADGRRSGRSSSSSPTSDAGRAPPSSAKLTKAEAKMVVHVARAPTLVRLCQSTRREAQYANAT